MRWHGLFLLALSMWLASCGRPASDASKSTPGKQPRDQWTLENYDPIKGYTFKKDGTSYLTECFLIEGKLDKSDDPSSIRKLGYTMDGNNDFHLDVQDQSQCNELLPYLHKTVPIHQGEEGFSEFLYFIAPDAARVEFVITETK